MGHNDNIPHLHPRPLFRITKDRIGSEGNNTPQKPTKNLVIFAVDIRTLVRYTCVMKNTNRNISIHYRATRCSNGWLKDAELREG